MHSPVLVTIDLSVRLSVCPSVHLWVIPLYPPLISNGHISATGHPIHFMFGSVVGFSRSADRMALIHVGPNKSGKISNGHISATGHTINFMFGMAGLLEWGFRVYGTDRMPVLQIHMLTMRFSTKTALSGIFSAPRVAGIRVKKSLETTCSQTVERNKCHSYIWERDRQWRSSSFQY